MKRKRYSYYLNDEEYTAINEYAKEHGRPMSQFVRQFALAEIKKHKREKSVYKRLEMLEQAIRKICI